ncbi:MAG TPA: DUF3306 domain-containing protein [Albitalea sp.]|nr:DUF3306 domain-containing protein [Albitalea sp.]
MSEDGFLSRWARRKAEARDGRPGEATATVIDAPVPVVPPPSEPAAVLPAEPQAAVEPAPTMDDVAQLAAGADIRRFLAPAVDESVKRAAMKKLFADPHFNVMDGLDTYIDDYNKADPIPLAMLRKMAQSHALGLFEDEATEERAPKASTDGAANQQVPQSPEPHDAVPPDEDADLRLQQDDAAGCGGAGEGPAA